MIKVWKRKTLVKSFSNDSNLINKPTVFIAAPLAGTCYKLDTNCAPLAGIVHWW